MAGCRRFEPRIEGTPHVWTAAGANLRLMRRKAQMLFPVTCRGVCAGSKQRCAREAALHQCLAGENGCDFSIPMLKTND